MHPITTLFLLALPIACVAWTVTKEEVFREPREFCQKRAAPDCGGHILKRKLFYLPTCEYCFSHYVTALTLLATGFKLAFTGQFTDYILTGFALVFISNIYMSAYFRLRLSVKHTGAQAKVVEAQLRYYDKGN